MPFGLGIGQVVALVRETRGFEGALPQISVSGEGASELALSLSTGGDAGAVLVGSDPGLAVVAMEAEVGDARREHAPRGELEGELDDGHLPILPAPPRPPRPRTTR